MAESSIVKVKGDLTIVLTDNAAGNTYTITKEPGDFSLAIGGRAVNLFLDRGIIGDPPDIRYGDEAPMTGSFSVYFRDGNDAATATAMNFIGGSSGQVASWVSTLGATGEVPVWTLTVTIEGTDHGDAADHTIVCNYVFITGAYADGDPNTLTVNFTAYDVYPTVT